MNVKLTKGGSASQADVAALEKYLGCSLPADFKTFLGEHDGAKPEDNIFDINEDNDSGVQRFIPAKEILREREGIDNLASQTVPIAWDECGNCVLLNAATDEVQFWDHETAEATAIASSFGGFLSMLQPFSIDNVELDPDDIEEVWVDPEFLKQCKEKEQEDE